MGPPKRLPMMRVGRGRGRIMTSSLRGGGRGMGIRPTTSIRGRIGRIEGRPGSTVLRRRILTSTSLRSRELLRYKTSKIRS